MGFKKDKVLAKNVKLAPPLLGVKVLNCEKSSDGKTFYIIEVLPSVPLVSPDVTMLILVGRSYKIKRRFEDFQFFHALLVEKFKKEYGDPLLHTAIANVVPDLPRKRLFSSNSNNEEILLGLMEYVRKLFMLPKVIYKSRLLSEFFGMWKDDYKISENILIYKAVSSILINSKPVARPKMQDISLDEEWLNPVAQQRLSLLSFSGHDFLSENEVPKVKPNTPRRTKLNEVVPLQNQTRNEPKKEPRKETLSKERKEDRKIENRIFQISQQSRDSILIKEDARNFIEEIMSVESSPFSENTNFGSLSYPITSSQPAFSSNTSLKPKTREMSTYVSETLLRAQSQASFRAMKSPIEFDANCDRIIPPLNTSPTNSKNSIGSKYKAKAESNLNQFIALDNDYNDLNRSRSTESINPKYAVRNSSLNKSALKHSKSFVSSSKSAGTLTLDRFSDHQKGNSEEKTDYATWNIKNFTIGKSLQTSTPPKSFDAVEAPKPMGMTSTITSLGFTSMGNDIHKRAVGIFVPNSTPEFSASSSASQLQANEISFRGRDEVSDKKWLRREKSIEIMVRPLSSNISDKWDVDLERQRHLKLTESNQHRSGVFAVAAVGDKPYFMQPNTIETNKNRDSDYSVSPFEDGYQSYAQDNRRRSKLYMRSHTIGNGTRKDILSRYLQCKCIVDSEISFLINFSRNIGFESLLHKISVKLLSVIDEAGNKHRKVESIKFKDGDGHLVRICDEEDWGICLAESSYLLHLTLFVASSRVNVENALGDDVEQSNYQRKLSVSQQARPNEFYEKIESPTKSITRLSFNVTGDGHISAPALSKQTILSPITYNQRSFTPQIPQRNNSLLLNNTNNRTLPLATRSQAMHTKGAHSYDSNISSDRYQDIREEKIKHRNYTLIPKSNNENSFPDLNTAPREDFCMFNNENPVLRKKILGKNYKREGYLGNYSDDERDVPAFIVEHEQRLVENFKNNIMRDSTILKHISTDRSTLLGSTGSWEDYVGF
ncbi:hypothetical protein HK096_000342 [Nowakowskiella sp. JEL0078]|nr:hypothetical protein HK096_000342 [Nowakowskiella sp. JEL0078]